jgi:hypothetical protein
MPEIDLVGVVHDNDLYIEREMRCKRRGPGHRMQAIKTGLVSDYGPTKFAVTLVRASSLAVDSDLPDSHKHAYVHGREFVHVGKRCVCTSLIN